MSVPALGITAIITGILFVGFRGVTIGPSRIHVGSKGGQVNKKAALSLIVLTSLTGCGIYNRRLAQTMTSWVGTPVTQVINRWGPPTTVYEEAPYKVYVWSFSNTESFDRPNRVDVVTFHSYRMFWVDSTGNCVKWKFGRQ